MELLFTPEQKTITLLRTISLTIPQVADKMGCGFNHANNSNRALHQNIGEFTGMPNVTGMLVLGIGVAAEEISAGDLRLLFASQGICFNK